MIKYSSQKKKPNIEKNIINYFSNIDNKKNHSVKNYSSRETIIRENQPPKIINKRLSLNQVITPTIRAIGITDSSNNSFNFYNKENKNTNTNIKRPNKNIIIPRNKQKKIKYSILTSEANSMIKNYSAKKKESKSRNLQIEKKIKIIDNYNTSKRYISSPLITQGNNSKSFH